MNYDNGERARVIPELENKQRIFFISSTFIFIFIIFFKLKIALRLEMFAKSFSVWCNIFYTILFKLLVAL